MTSTSQHVGVAQRVFDFLGEAATFRLWQVRLLGGIAHLDDQMRHPALRGRMRRLDRVLAMLAQGLRINEAATWLVSNACSDLVLIPPPISKCLVPLHALPLVELGTSCQSNRTLSSNSFV